MMHLSMRAYLLKQWHLIFDKIRRFLHPISEPSLNGSDIESGTVWSASIPLTKCQTMARDGAMLLDKISPMATKDKLSIHLAASQLAQRGTDTTRAHSMVLFWR
jgi:hypothetical protein